MTKGTLASYAASAIIAVFLVKTLAHTTLLCSNAERIGRPQGCEALRKGLGSRTPFAFATLEIGISLAFEKVPQGGANQMKKTLPARRSPIILFTTSSSRRFETRMGTLGLCRFPAQSMATVSKPCGLNFFRQTCMATKDFIDLQPWHVRSSGILDKTNKRISMALLEREAVTPKALPGKQAKELAKVVALCYVFLEQPHCLCPGRASVDPVWVVPN